MRRQILILILTAISSLSFAQTAPHGALYQNTFRRCSTSGNTRGVGSQVRAIWESFDFQATRDGFTEGLQVVTLDPVAIGDVVRHRGLSKRVAEMLNSPEFYSALTACYGPNESLKHTYIAGLIASDVGGKVLAAGVAVGVGAVTVKVLGAAVATYPYMKAALYTAGAGFSVYNFVHAVRSVTREATPHERAQVRRAITPEIGNSDALFDRTKDLLRQSIRDLRADYMSAPPSEREKIRRRIMVLTDQLDQLNSLKG